jgi:hypothetical protein
VLLQRHGYFVPRCLAADVLGNLEATVAHVLDVVAHGRASHRRRPAP